MSRSMDKTWMGGVVGALLVLGILIAGNALIRQLHLRKDFTEERLYTLSEGTAGLLQALDRDVTLHFFFSRSNEAVPMPLKLYAQRVSDLLREYELHGGGRLVVETHDPRPDSDAEEWAQKYGLAPQGLGPMGTGGDLYFGLMAQSGAQEAVLPFLSPAEEGQLEYLLTRLVAEVTAERRPVMGVLSSLPVLGDRTQQGQEEGWFAISELRNQYEVRSLPSASETIPEDIDVLLLVHPQDPGEQLLFALDQFVLRGGRLLAFLDPYCMSADDGSGMGPTGRAASEINRLTGAWGIAMDAEVLVWDPDASSNVSFAHGRAASMPTWLTLRRQHIDRQDVLTGSLNQLMLPFAGAFVGEPVEGLEKTVLLKASGDARLVNKWAGVSAEAARLSDGQPAPEAALAIRLQGRFPTAFPDGPPPGDADREETGAPGAEETWLKESARPGVVVLVGDVDMLNNQFSVAARAFFDTVIYQPVNDNLHFALNTAEQLAGSEALIGLRSRGTHARPFERVLAMEREAQARWREQENLLQDRLIELQQRLANIEAKQTDSQTLILTPEQADDIERFRQQRFETQQQLKEVRRNLRRDIERLGMQLKIINMAAVPALVILVGIGYGTWRHRRTAG